MRSLRLFRGNDLKLLLSFRRFFRLDCLRFSGEGRRFDRKESGWTSADDSIKVTVMGAAGRVGRTLSLLLKTSPLVDRLCMFDIDNSVKGFAVDISHIDTKCCVNYVCGMQNIQEALDDPDVVLIAAGSPISPELYGKKLFKMNAPIVAGLSEACARFCPDACIVLITNPINSLLPVAGEVYKLVTGENPCEKLFGLTTLDVVRANTFTAEAIRHDPSKVIVPVIGGTSEETIVPVISQMKPCCKIKHEEIVALTECVKQAEGSLSDCQNCGARGSSSLSTAYAAFRFSSALISALKGEENVVECAYVQSDILPELEYLASPLKLGKCGIEYNYGYPKLSEYEVKLLENGAMTLKSDIALGKLYVIENKSGIVNSPANGFDSPETGNWRSESKAKSCGVHDVMEVIEPEETVTLNGGESEGEANVKSQKIHAVDVRSGYSAVVPCIVKRVVANGKEIEPDDVTDPERELDGVGRVAVGYGHRRSFHSGDRSREECQRQRMRRGRLRLTGNEELLEEVEELRRENRELAARIAQLEREKANVMIFPKVRNFCRKVISKKGGPMERDSRRKCGKPRKVTADESVPRGAEIPFLANLQLNGCKSEAGPKDC